MWQACAQRSGTKHDILAQKPDMTRASMPKHASQFLERLRQENSRHDTYRSCSRAVRLPLSSAAAILSRRTLEEVSLALCAHSRAVSDTLSLQEHGTVRQSQSRKENTGRTTAVYQDPGRQKQTTTQVSKSF